MGAASECEALPFGRASVDGKFLSAGCQTFFVRGVTYGAFRSDDSGREYTDTRLIERDFAHMARLGLTPCAFRTPCRRARFWMRPLGTGCESWLASRLSKARAI